jgi:predicted Zn-dependent protease
MLISMHMQARDFNAAYTVAREALAIAPRDQAVRLANGRILLALQRNVEAVQQLDQLARDTSFSNVDVLHELARARLVTRNLSEARRVVELALQQSQRKHVPSIQLATSIAMQEKRLQDARALLGDLNRLRGDSPEVQELTGDLAVAENRFADSIAPYRNALRGAPSTAMVGKLSAALVRAGDRAAAITELQGWVRQYPRDVGARLQLADIYLAAGQAQQAQAAYEAILQSAPNNPLALNNLAWLYLQRGDRRARATSERALRLLPDNPEIMDTAAWIRFKSGSSEGVLAMLRRAAELSPNPEIRYHLAEVLASEGDKAGAKRELDRILAPGAPAFASRADALKLRQRL